MGTRHVTVVRKDNEVKVAQYGQWDGYPSGQGVTVIDFLNDNNIEDFKRQIDKVKFIEDEKSFFEKAYKEAGIQVKDGMITYEDGQKFTKNFPELSRDTGAGILKLILDNKLDEMYLQDSTDFISSKDGFSCEFVHEIDLDKNTYKIIDCYKKVDIFTYDISKVPTTEEFLKEVDEYDELLGVADEIQDEYIETHFSPSNSSYTYTKIKDFFTECKNTNEKEKLYNKFYNFFHPTSVYAPNKEIWNMIETEFKNSDNSITEENKLETFL